jgi:hypothetical protein
VVGPFFGPTPQRISLDEPTPVEAAMRPDGALDLAATYPAADGRRLAWKAVEASRRGLVDLAGALGAHEWCNGYAYTEIDSVHPREAVLRCGSDDGIAIWLNGKRIHRNEVARGVNPDADQMTIQLKAGTNRLLVKVDNYTAGWGFQVGVSAPTH